MKLVERHVDSFTVVGVEARTTNAREASGQGVIGPLWRKLEKPAGKQIIAVYCEYQSNRDGEYTYVLGTKGNGTHRVAAGRYALLTAKGPITPEVVVDLWKQIWSLEDTHEIRRSYKTDFELHGDAQLALYVGVEA